MDTLLLITLVHNFVQLCTIMLLLGILFSEDLTYGVILVRENLSMWVHIPGKGLGVPGTSHEGACSVHNHPTYSKACGWFIAMAWVQTDLGTACSCGGDKHCLVQTSLMMKTGSKIIVLILWPRVKHRADSKCVHVTLIIIYHSASRREENNSPALH